MEDVSELQAQAAFAANVQNIAFSLVLSKQMVDSLQLIYRGGGSQPWSAYFNPLVRRGLVIIERGVGGDWRTIHARLSQAGEMATKLLLHADMISGHAVGKTTTDR